MEVKFNKDFYVSNNVFIKENHQSNFLNTPLNFTANATIEYNNIKINIILTKIEIQKSKTLFHFDKTNQHKFPNYIKNCIIKFKWPFPVKSIDYYDELIDLINIKHKEITVNNNQHPTIFYIGMEKTGSSSIKNGFPTHSVAHFHSTEYFENIYKTKLLTSNNRDIYDLILYIGKKYNFKPLIIECIREPISQITSAIIQHLKQCKNCKDPDFCDMIFPTKRIEGIKNIHDLIKKSITPYNWINYKYRGFQSLKLWKKHFNVNLLKNKSSYFELDDVKLAFLRYEDIEFRPSFFKKIGYDYIETHSNQTEKHVKVGELYIDVKKHLNFTNEELDKIYSDEVRLFYTKDEIQKFKDKYLFRE